MSESADPTGLPPVEPIVDARTEFTIAHADLRRALIRAIARRAGKSLEPISHQEAYSDISLVDLYYRKLHTDRFARVFDRLPFRRWRSR